MTAEFSANDFDGFDGEFLSLPAESGGIALVQSASGTTDDGSAGLTVSFGVPVTAGNSVIALISYDNSGDNTGFDVAPILVGGGAESIPSVAGVISGTALQASLRAVNNVAGGETGVTYTLDVAVRASMTIIEVSNLADTAPIDTDTNTGTGSLASLTGLTGTGACYAIFAVESVADPFSDLASNVNVTGIGVGLYSPRGENPERIAYNLAGQPDSLGGNYAMYWDGGSWCLSDENGGLVNFSNDDVAYPWLASWTGSVVTESPSDWTLVTIPPVGGSNVWQCVAWKVGAATPVSVELKSSLAWSACGFIGEPA